jgi:DNA-binding MarR family transcriptional regulator
MAASDIDDPLLGTLCHSMTGLVRWDGPDLTARQLAMFLACYLETKPQPVGALATRLNVSKPVVSKALNRLRKFSLIRRQHNPWNRRIILIHRTPEGVCLLQKIGEIMEEAFVKASRVEPLSPGHPRRIERPATNVAD